MEGDDVSIGNLNIVCQYRRYMSTFGLAFDRRPLDFAVPLILMQFTVISITSQTIDSLLQPLGQSSQVAHIIAGIVLGPSMLGNKRILGNLLFPPRSLVTLETAALLGIVFFFFAIGVRLDPGPMVKPNRQSAVIGLSCMLLTMTITMSLAIVLKTYVSMDERLANALPMVAMSQTLTAFPNISCLLVELKMSSSNIGRLAMTSSMFCDLLGISLTAVSLAMQQSANDPVKSVLAVVSTLFLVLFMVYVIKPIVSLAAKRLPTGKALPEHYVFFLFTGNLLSAFASEAIGQHFIFGPLVFGLMVPSGPPLGPALITKLDSFTGKFLYFTFLATLGLKTFIFDISFRNFWVIAVIVLVSCLAKIIAVLFSAHIWKMDIQDTVILGLLLNARGVCELVVYNLWWSGGVLSDQDFTLCVLSVVGVTALITPLIRYIYDPYKQHLPLKRSTIQHLKRDTELRMLICLQTQEDVPTIINILEASNATEDSPIAILAVLLVELVGRATPMLVSHQATPMGHSADLKSKQIINALHQYEYCNENCVTVKWFSAISQFQTMHDDICRVALDQNATMVILPFHKRWEIDGSICSVSRGIQGMNIKMLESSPCSIGILVDRGVLTGSSCILNNQSIYHICIIYIGGPDDAESLCYGARMAKHYNVTLTVIRYLLLGHNSARERKTDTQLVDEVRHDNLGNENFVYQEQVVKDGVGLAASLRDLGSSFDLLLAGRNHQQAEIVSGLEAWSECPELGVVGDILASPDFRSTSSVLVVQQQRIIGKKFKDKMKTAAGSNHESSYDSLPALDVRLDSK